MKKHIEQASAFIGARCGAAPSTAQLELLDAYAALVLEKNRDFNLTAASDAREIWLRHIADGAAALLLSTEPRPGRPAVRWRSRTQVNEFLPLSRRDPTRFEGAALAWARGLDAAGLALADLDLVETHDCFTIAELLEYEAMGLAPQGQGARVILDGVSARDGRLPVNLSGGLKARGHPIGATGVSMHAMVAMQLTGEAGAMQLPGARLGAAFNMGGAAVANYLSVLEAA